MIPMIPYFKAPPLALGPLTIEPFGVLTALGILVGAWAATRRARQEGLDTTVLADFLVWGVLGGVLGGHLFHLFFYHPEELRNPGKVLRVWDGLSSFGGLLGALAVALLYFRRRGVVLSQYQDAMALGLAPGWAIARLGCFVIHDHPGVLTDFPLAVAFPGGPRHDLGLYDALWLGLWAGVLFLCSTRPAMRGRLLPLLALGYGVGRFGFDFLRARDLSYVDPRYAGLTPAQYACLLLVGWGLYRLWRPGTRS